MNMLKQVSIFFLGYQTMEEGIARAKLTMTKVLTDWPRESFFGFLVHWTNRGLVANTEYSTIDTAECILGAIFAGNYFGGEVKKTMEN